MQIIRVTVPAVQFQWKLVWLLWSNSCKALPMLWKPAGKLDTAPFFLMSLSSSSPPQRFVFNDHRREFYRHHRFSKEELTAAIASEVIGATMFAWVIGNLVNLMLNLDPAERNRNSMMTYLTEYLRVVPLSSKAKKTIARNYTFHLKVNSHRVYLCVKKLLLLVAKELSIDQPDMDASKPVLPPRSVPCNIARASSCPGSGSQRLQSVLDTGRPHPSSTEPGEE